MATLWLYNPHQVSSFSVPYEYRPYFPARHRVSQAHHDSRTRGGKRRGSYRGCALWDVPRDGVGGVRAVRRTVPKVKKVDMEQAAHN